MYDPPHFVYINKHKTEYTLKIQQDNNNKDKKKKKKKTSSPHN